MFEKLPAPFGLVRYGVSPLHPDVKNVIHKFQEIAAHPKFKFYGNVNVGEDVSLYAMMKSYNAVVLAYGSSLDISLDVPGEDSIPNIFSSKAFVGWYNGHPDFATLSPDLDTDTAVMYIPSYLVSGMEMSHWMSRVS